MGRPHVLVIPYPAQGHVMPLMELSYRLIDFGFKITFVNTEFSHKRIVASLATNYKDDGTIHLVTIPDGLGADEDRNALENLNDTMLKVMPAHLEDLIVKTNESNTGDEKITSVIADMNMGWALEVAKSLGIKGVGFWPPPGALLALTLQIPKFIEDGIIDANGLLMKKQMIQLSPAMPAINPAHFPWLCMGGELSLQTNIFHLLVKIIQDTKRADCLICNSCYELEPWAFALVPKLQPIGPLYASSRLANFWHEDSTCLSWLDQQRARSVIYVAFGSFTVLEKQKFYELALGLELSGQPFLWVVRPDLTDTDGLVDMYPDGFKQRVASRGKIVNWAPQREVLAHPSVGCFLTHCGWNSTMEGLSQGIPFLCWPYFADQFLNESFICDIWKIGLRLDKDEQNGIISSEEIKEKVVRLFGGEEIKASSLKWKEIVMNHKTKGGSSWKNFEDFVQEIK